MKKATTMFYGSASITFKNAALHRSKMTGAEKILWECLSKKQIDNFRFRRQHPIAHYIADFYCHQAKLIIEVDGEVHGEEDQIEYDAVRTRQLEELGITVIRFTNHQVICQINDVIKIIKETLNKKSPL